MADSQQTSIQFGPVSLDLSALNGTNGFVLNGIKANDYSGYSVASAGDVNDDGIADFLIGAPFVNNYAGQSYVVLGARYFSLMSNQLNISNGSSTLLTPSDVSINPSSNITLFIVNDVQHGQFEEVNNPGIAITEFTQPQLIDRQVVFYHDGSNISPYYTLACSQGLLEIAPQIAQINFTSGMMQYT